MKEAPKPTRNLPRPDIDHVQDIAQAVKLIEARPKVEGRLCCQIIDWRMTALIEDEQLFPEESMSVMLSMFLSTIAPEDVRELIFDYQWRCWHVIYLYRKEQESIFDSLIQSLNIKEETNGNAGSAGNQSQESEDSPSAS